MYANIMPTFFPSKIFKKKCDLRLLECSHLVALQKHHLLSAHKALHCVHWVHCLE